MVLIVGAAGIVTYQSLAYILSAIKNEAKPNLTLVLLKEVNSNLVRGESNLKYYSLTGQEKYIKHYHDQLSSLDKKINQLYWYNQTNSVRKAQIDTLNGLIKEKSRVWSKMLLQRTDNRVGEALNELELKLDSVSDTITLKVPTSVKIMRADSSKSMAKAKDENIKSDDNFFTRLFKRKTEDVKLPANKEPVVLELLEETIEERDTTLGVGIDKNLLQEQISRIRQAEGDTLRKMNAQEIILVKRNEYITQRINQLIVRMERQELNSISTKAIEADLLVDKTNKWIIAFLTGFAILVLAVFLVITRYVRKTNAIQENLIKSKEEALKLTRAKEVFMANMSHEIRTPMNAIVGFSEQVLQSPHDFQTKEQLTIIKKSADHLLRIINDILDLSKLEAGKLAVENEAFSLLSLVNDIVQLYKPTCEAKGVVLEPVLSDTLPEVLIGDAFRLKQILLNLVGNAVKFTSEGKISIHIGSSNYSRSAINLKVKVSDTGIGIQQDQLELIFEEFKQADTSTTRRYGGTGLGLSIVKKLIELQHGKLTVTSQLGKGSDFSFSIPFKTGKKEDLRINNTKTLDTQSLSNISFLVADDDEYNRKLIAHILNKWKVKYTLVKSGKELLNEFERNQYDIILLDIRMPEIDGIEATEKIRYHSKSKQKDIPIIALTAAIAKEDIKRCTDAGIDTIILKPYTEETLLWNILKALKIELDFPNDYPLDKQEPGGGKAHKVNYDNLFHLANNDEKFVVEMLEMFIKTSQSGMEKIDIAVAQNNLIDIAENAHKIKSPCKHLGAIETADLLKEIENKARNNCTVQEITDMLEKAKSDIHSLIYEVQDFLKQANEKQNVLKT